MKKLLSTLLALSLALSLGACAVKVDPSEPDEPAKDELRIVFTEEHLTKEVEYKADDGTVLLIEKYDLPQLEVRTSANEVYTPPVSNAAVDVPQEYAAALAFNAEMQRAADALDASAQEALAMAVHVTGRTDFDREYVSRINPNIIYHFMNETLREEFYHDSWNIDTIERYSVFLSQGNYPIKGLHYVLDILPELVEEHEETMLYVAGDVITAHKTLKDKIKISGYGKYLLSQIRKSKMEDHVKFVGALQPDKMCARYLKSHVFLCPSAIENSPNSVGEAMLLGVPTVGANVGGVHNLLTDNKDGFLYQPDKPQQMKAEILRIFNDDKLAMSLSSNARTHAARTHDPDWNYRRLLEIYHEIDHSI